MKIFSPQLGLSPESTLGGEVHDFNVIEQLANKGVEVDILLPRGREFKITKGVRIEYLPYKHIPAHLFNAIVVPYLFKEYQEGVRVFRFHNPYFLGVAGVVLKKRHPDAKIFTTIHLKEERRDLDLILRKTIHIYDKILTVSEYLKRWVIKEYGVDPHKIEVIYNGVEKDLKPGPKDKKLVSKLGIAGKFILLNIGSLSERKNIIFLLEVFKNLTKNRGDLVLIFCGAGPLKSELKQKIRKYNLEKQVMIIDPVYKKEKVKVYNLADLFLFPSKNEGFGLVGVEAQSCGKLVLASNNTSLPEIIDDGVSGYLIKTGDLKAWADKINQLIDNPTLRKKVADNGYKAVKKRFNWERTAELSYQVIKKLS